MLDHQEDGDKPIWIFDIREPQQSSQYFDISGRRKTLIISRIRGHFGPHNIHENRPGSFVSSDLIFATYQNAGVRVFDIRDKYAPVEVGALVPPAHRITMMDGKLARKRRR